MITKNQINGIEVISMENNYLQIAVVPELGGKILSVFNRALQKEFLWMNKNLLLQKQPTGADYDSNFIGAIDELLPNDMPETIDGINYPDHGELWTTALDHEEKDNSIIVHGKLALSGLQYSKTISLLQDELTIQLDYSITNTTNAARHFLWKLHAALNIEAGDRLISNAKTGQVVDPAYSRFADTSPFNWSVIEGTDASLVPPENNTVDFFYLYDISKGEMKFISKNGHAFIYSYDEKIFPYQWYFASYGGFLNHYTAILEPCTNMPMSVNEAKEKKQCAVLQPGETLNTSVTIYAGKNK